MGGGSGGRNGGGGRKKEKKKKFCREEREEFEVATPITDEEMSLERGWTAVYHGVEKVVVAKKQREERETSIGKIKKAGFWPNFDMIVFMLRSWNPLLFIGGGRG